MDLTDIPSPPPIRSKRSSWASNGAETAAKKPMRRHVHDERGAKEDEADGGGHGPRWLLADPWSLDDGTGDAWFARRASDLRRVSVFCQESDSEGRAWWDSDSTGASDDDDGFFGSSFANHVPWHGESADESDSESIICEADLPRSRDALGATSTSTGPHDPKLARFREEVDMLLQRRDLPQQLGRELTVLRIRVEAEAVFADEGGDFRAIVQRMTQRHGACLRRFFSANADGDADGDEQKLFQLMVDARTLSRRATPLAIPEAAAMASESPNLPGRKARGAAATGGPATERAMSEEDPRDTSALNSSDTSELRETQGTENRATSLKHPADEGQSMRGSGSKQRSGGTTLRPQGKRCTQLARPWKMLRDRSWSWPRISASGKPRGAAPAASI